MTASPNALTLVSAGTSLAKRVIVVAGGVTRAEDPDWPRIVSFATVEIASTNDLLDVLSAAAEEIPVPCVVRAAPLADLGRRALYDDAEKGPAGLQLAPRCWVGYDTDHVPADGIDPLLEPERAVAQARQCLPPEHHDASVVWQITASAGKRDDELRLRLWFRLDHPMLGRQLERWCQPGIAAGWLDPCTLRNEVLPHFIAVSIAAGAPDPCPQRWGLIRGDRDAVTVPDHAVREPVRRAAHFSSFSSATLADRGAELQARCRNLGDRRRDVVRLIHDEIERVRASGKGARHPTYLRAAARIHGLCQFWAIPLDQPRDLLEAAYRETLTAYEARQRDHGSIRGVWAWLYRRSA
jgi:hypothetical protein